jgi:molybdate transport system regulatory protein
MSTSSGLEAVNIAVRRKKTLRGSVVLRPRMRVLCNGEIALGPGRVDLLERIVETGSLRAAAAGLGMSYMRAWTMLKSLNARFRSPLVDVARGGKTGGGAKVTKTGREVIERYRRMEKESQTAIERTWKGLRKLLRG